MRSLLVIALLVIACCAVLLHAQEPASPVKATIEGTIADETGTPLRGVQVEALSYVPGVTNSKPAVVGTAFTDNQGHYSITVAAAGRVLLRAQRRAGGVSVLYVKYGDSERPVTTMVATVKQVYYPQAAIPEGATPLEVTPGAKVQHVDFQIHLPQQETIQGFTVQEITKN